MIRVCVLDVVTVARDGGPAVPVGSLQQKAVLTLLVAAKGRSVSIDAIADELWPDVRPRRWRGCIATLANSLRMAAGGDRDLVFSTARGYTLHRRPEAVVTDVEALQRFLDQARQAEEGGRYDVAETLARRAVRLYGSGPWTTDYWGWNEAAAEAARVLSAALLRRGAHAACVNELSGIMEDFDWHEGLWACLVSAHHRLGSTRRALDLMEKAKLAVGGPTPVLSELQEQITADSVCVV